MPKRKTGAAKKREKQLQRQKLIRANKTCQISLMEHPCNKLMTCDSCDQLQKTRAFCYFCASMQRVPFCCECGRSKCLYLGGDCMLKHPNAHATGRAFVGAICDFCEAFICHSKRCLTTHACACPLRDMRCVVCERGVWEHGGRFFRCAYCNSALCEEEQMEHQGTCEQLENETFKCQSCNRLGQYMCLQCKVAYCDTHVKRKGVKIERDAKPPCPKCQQPCGEISDHSISVRRHEYGRKTAEDSTDDYTAYSAWAATSSYSDAHNTAGAMYHLTVHDDDESDTTEDEEESESSESSTSEVAE